MSSATDTASPAAGPEEDARKSPVVGLLLAAGIGRRFDPDGRRDKLLADAEGVAVATRSARKLVAGCDRVIAVIRPASAALRTALAAGGIVDFTECPDARLGMGHSLAHGALAAAALRPRRLVVALADMPWIDVATIQALVDAADAANGVKGGAGADVAGKPAAGSPGSSGAGLIVVPEYRGQRGHPVVFGVAHLAALARCEGDRGAAALLAEYPVRRIAVEDAGVVRDVDKPADLLPGHDED